MSSNRKLFGEDDNRFGWTNYTFNDDLWSVTLPKSLALVILEIKATRYNKYRMLIFCAYLLNSIDKKTIFRDQLIEKSKSSANQTRQKLKRVIDFNYESNIINISSGFFKKHFGNNFWAKVLNPLIIANIISRDDKYCSRGKSLGYSFKLDFDNNQVIHFEINIRKHIRLLSNLNEDLYSRNFYIIPSGHRYIYENLNKFYIDETSLRKDDMELYEKTENQIKKINSDYKNFNFRWNRLYTDYTNINSKTRKYIKLKNSNEKLVEIDITSSYLCMLIYHIEHFELLVQDKNDNQTGYTSNSHDYKKFKKDVLNGCFYDIIANSLFDGDRKKAKEFVFRVLFSPYWRIRNKKKGLDEMEDVGKSQVLLGEFLENNYTCIAQYLKEKKERDYLRMFSLELSMIESSFMFDNVCPKLKDLTPFITIHDAIIVPETKKAEVLKIITETSKEFFDFELPLKINTL